jgi:hypothetical protein
MAYNIGAEINLNDSLGEGNARYFLALQRLDDGTLYFYKVDQVASKTSIAVNNPGPNANNFESFEYGVDFFDGRLATDHSRPYPNLVFDQYRWDSKDCYYYIDTQGNLVVRVNQSYTYSGSQIVVTG